MTSTWHNHFSPKVHAHYWANKEKNTMRQKNIGGEDHNVFFSCALVDKMA